MKHGKLETTLLASFVFLSYSFCASLLFLFFEVLLNFKVISIQKPLLELIIFGYAAIILIVIHYFNRKPSVNIKKKNIQIVIYAIIINLMIHFINMFYKNHIARLVFAKQNQLMQMINAGGIYLSIIVIGLLVPLAEEIIFRHYFFYKNIINGKIFAFFMGTIPFALIHLHSSIYSNNFLDDLSTLPLYLILSFLITFSYYQTNSLLTPFLIHMGNNLMSLIVIFNVL